MHRIQATTPIPRSTAKGTAPSRISRSGSESAAAGALGAIGLIGVLATVFLVSAGAAGAPSQYVPARIGGWPGWLAGPLAGLHMSLSSGAFQVFMLVMCGSYGLVLLTVRALPAGVLVAAIVGAHLLLLAGPPLISQDVFGYLAFARMGALHGLDPYTHVAAEAFRDPSYAFIGWPFLHSPYGPEFTLASYATAPLGLAGGLWAFKAVAVLSSLGAIALIATAAARLGQSGRWAAAFVGLNPVLLVLAVGGAHNDTLLLLAVGLALAVSAGAQPKLRTGAAALVVGVGVKLTAGLLLPFLVLAPARTRERLRVLAATLASLLALVVLGIIGFGVHALGFLGAVGEQQQLVASHSIPAETARLIGLSGTPAWWRHLFIGAFLVALLACLWRAARGSDWRVAAGWATLALLLSTAWLLPWYAIWLLPLAAVSNDRRLRAATLLFCAYAVLIHLPLADPLLSPGRYIIHRHPHLAVPGLRHRLELTGFQILGHVHSDLRW